MKQAFLVAGLAWGDEGKGATVDALVRRFGASLVVRYNGGPQAAHNVVTADGRHHTFSQFGSGTFVEGCETFLSRYMLIDPIASLREAAVLAGKGVRDPLKRVLVSPDAVIITPYQLALSQSRARDAGRIHTSCGRGIGIARDHELNYGTALRVSDLRHQLLLCEKLRQSWRLCGVGDAAVDTIDAIVKIYEDWLRAVRVVPDTFALSFRSTVVFEGAQGFLLDENFGEPGFNTWTDTTFRNADRLLDDCAFDGQRCRIGVLRSYATRHGRGPFPTEDPNLLYPEPHNGDAGCQGPFRRGGFCEDLALKAIRLIGGVDFVALNHLDQFAEEPRDMGAPIGIRSYGPTAADRIFSPEFLVGNETQGERDPAKFAGARPGRQC